jgi:hypothetical protein
MSALYKFRKIYTMFKRMIAKHQETLRLRAKAEANYADTERQIAEWDREDSIGVKHLDLFLFVLEAEGTDEEKRTGNAPHILQETAEYIARKHGLTVEKVLQVREVPTSGMLRELAHA